MNDRQKIQETILNTAQYYGRQLSGPVIAMMAEDFAGYPADAIVEAYAVYRRSGKNRVFPLPAQIIELLEGGNAKQNANALVVNLIAAVKRHDYTWPMQLNKSAYQTGSFEGDFKAELGVDAWNVVQMHGGWQRFCESYWNSAGNETTFKAQLRDLLEGAIDRRSMGHLIVFPERQAPHQIENRPQGPNPQQIALLRATAEDQGLTEVVAEIDRLLKKRDGGA